LFFSSNRRLPTGFIFQQDGAPSHTARSAQKWLQASCLDYITKNQWQLNSPNVNQMDSHVWGAMLETHCSLKQSPKQSPNLRKCFTLSGATCHKDRLARLSKTSEIKRLKNCVCWSLKLAVDTLNIHMTMEFQHLIVS